MQTALEEAMFEDEEADLGEEGAILVQCTFLAAFTSDQRPRATIAEVNDMADEQRSTKCGRIALAYSLVARPVWDNLTSALRFCIIWKGSTCKIWIWACCWVILAG